MLPADPAAMNTEPSLTIPAVTRASGVTAAERSLQRLCEGTFLTLWSYPAVYRDQGTGEQGGQGKEVADLLVVFGDNVIVFSDKDCAFPNSGDIALDWRRWFKRAVWKAAEQAWGAERWIREHPDRLFLDRACTEPFPLDLPPPERLRFHHVVVAHNASKPCRTYYDGGSGSLILTNALRGREHFDGSHQLADPFVVGDLDPSRGFVHVLDDTTLGVILKTLDTVADLTAYFEAKESLFRSPVEVMATGEEEMLARYLSDVDESTGEHDFCLPTGITHVVIEEGLWDQFGRSEARRSQVDADKISYAWDGLIERFNRHILSGTSYGPANHAPRVSERAVRLMAAEPRFRRRGLARAFTDLVLGVPPGALGKRTMRLVPSEHQGGTFYVFLVLTPRSAEEDLEAYRVVRTNLLLAYCMAAKHAHPHAQHIVGLACGPADAPRHSEDIIYLDAREWSPEQQEEAGALRRDLNLLNEVTYRRVTDQEYPAGQSWSPRVKNARNKPCACGSGRKYKHCHGRPV